jgi:aminoacrylate hydrolase
MGSLQQAATTAQRRGKSGRRSRLDAILAFDRRNELNRIALPTVVLCCADDILTPAYFSREYAELIPNADLVIVPRGGHAYAQTEAVEFNRRVLDFFLSAAPPSRSSSR